MGSTTPLRERFWESAAKQPNGCWLWTRSTAGKGYGRFWAGTREKYAHRHAWELANGRVVPDGHEVCHVCDTPGCINPAHLFIGTTKDNHDDAVRKGRKQFLAPPVLQSHCKRGHEFGGRNVMTLSRGERTCRACDKLRKKAFRDRRRAERLRHAS